MFNNGTNGYSLSDIAAVSGNNNDGFWGGDGAWWIIILFLFCFNGGWGNGWGNGFGGNGNAASTTLATSDIVRDAIDTNSIKTGQVDLAGQMANGFYNINTGMLNGFANSTMATTNGIQAIQTDICNLKMSDYQNTQGITDAIKDDTIASLQNMFTLSTQLNNMQANSTQCCCDTQNLINQQFSTLGYNLAAEECETRRTTLDGVRDIIDNNNDNTRQILDFLTQDRINALNAENAALKGQISQSEQNAYLINQLRPNANPAYIVANPYTGATYTSYGCGYGCGCNA